MAAKENRQPPYPKAMHGVKGSLSRRQANFLYDAPARLGAGVYLEIGTYRGRSTLCTASGIRDSGVDAHLIAVDAFDLEGPIRYDKEGIVAPSDKYTKEWRFGGVQQTFKDRGLADYATIVRGYSVPTSKEYKAIRFNFVFIDADHSYAGCKADFVAWSPMVKSGGEIAFHDTHLPEVDRVVEESGWELVATIGTMKVIKKS